MKDLIDNFEDLFEEKEEYEHFEKQREYADSPEQIADWLREFIARDAME